MISRKFDRSASGREPVETRSRWKAWGREPVELGDLQSVACAGRGPRGSKANVPLESGWRDENNASNYADGRGDRPIYAIETRFSNEGKPAISGAGKAMFTKLIQRFTAKKRTERRQKPSQRRLRMERLDKRELLAGDINSISGTVYNDLTGNGLTVDDPRLSGIDVRLYRDGGDTVFGGDDTTIGTVTTGAPGTYLFDDLEPGLYFLQQLTTPVGVLVPAPIPITITRNTTEVIDGFDQTADSLLVSAGAPLDTSNLPAPEAIGGRRKIELTYGGGPSSVSVEINTVNNRFALNSDNASFGSAILRYDGDATGIPLDPDGLGGVNLSSGDADSGLVLQVFRNTFVAAQTYTLRIYTDANNFSEVDHPFDPAIINANYLDFIPFADFTPGTGATGPANFANVGAIELLVTNDPDQNIRVSVFEAIAPRDVTSNLENLNNEADLEIDKTLQGVVVNGDNSRTATFQIDVTNNGVLPATGITVADVFPAGMTFGSIGTVGNPGVLPAGVTVASTVGQTTTFNLTGLANGATRSFLVIANIAAGVFGTLNNTVTVDGAEPDNDLTNNEATAAVTLTETDLSILKTVETTTGNPIPPATVQTGQTIVYRLVAANAGPDNATGVIVVDTLPPDVTFVSATINGGAINAGIVHNAGTVTATIGNLANAAQAVVLITATVNSDSAALITNQAVVSNTPNTDPDLSNNESDANVTVTRAVDLAVTKAVAAGSNPAFGGTVTYEVTVTNVATSLGDARGFTVTDTLPAGLTLVNGSFDANGTGVTLNAVGQVLTFTGVPLDIGQAVTFSFDVTVGQTAAATLTNTATVAPFDNGTVADVDLVPGNNQDSETINPTRQIDLVVTKDDGIANGAFATPGEAITYSITVTNTGTSDAVNVNVVDTLPAGVVATSITVNGNQVVDNNPDAGILSFVLPSVPTGVPNAVTVLVTANIGAAVTGAITNSVTISGGGVGDPVAGNTATVTTNLQPEVDARITKTGPATAIPGGTAITYTLQVVNDGPSVATNAVVTDTLPAGLTLQSITLGGTAVNNTGTGNNVQFTIPQLLVGNANAQTYTITATVAASATGALSNSATVTATGDTNPANNTSTAVVTNLTPNADIGVTKSVSAANAAPGNQLTYNIVVTNNGPSVAQGVTLTDVLPAGVTFVSGTGPGGAALTAAGQTVNVTIGTLNPGIANQLQYSIIASVNAGFEGVLTNQVTVATTTNEGANTAPNVATVNTTSAIPDTNDARLSGIAFLDNNNDGIFNGTDQLLEGLTVNLRAAGTAAILRTTTTNAQGQWEFDNLPAGSYDVQLIRPAGLLDGLENPGDNRPVTNFTDSTIPGLTLTRGQDLPANNIGLQQAISKRRFLASAFRPA